MKKIYFRNEARDHLFPGHVKDSSHDHKVFSRPEAQNHTQIEDRFLWEVPEYPAQRVLIKNERYGFLFGSDVRKGGDRTVWCKESPSEDDLRSERFLWDIIAHGDGYRLRNCQYGYAFAADRDTDGDDHFIELREHCGDDKKYSFKIEEWNFGRETCGDGFRYWQLEFDEEGRFVSELQRQLFPEIVKSDLGELSELFIFVHGMGNDRIDASRLYNGYFKQMRTAAKELGISDAELSRVGVCGIVWPSGGGTDYLSEAAGTISKLFGKIVNQAVKWVSPDTGESIDVKLDSLAGVRHLVAMRAAQGVAPHIDSILKAHPSLRIHIIAHSMGTVLAGWLLYGLTEKVESVFLVQGALQSRIFNAGNLLAGREMKVKGYVAATISKRDEIFSKTALMADERLAFFGFQSATNCRSLALKDVTPAKLAGAKFINIECTDDISDHNDYVKSSIVKAHWAIRGY